MFQMFALFSVRHIDVHQHGAFTLGSVKFWETFLGISKVWENAQVS